jgi:RimJ/RimL family protein N-acetyltransferase
MFPDLTRDDVFMIGTRRLWLRWPTADDAEALARIGGHPEVAAMTGTWPVGCDAELARERIARHRTSNAGGKALSLVLARRQYWGEAIGLIGISLPGETSGERPVGTLGYHLAPEHWSRGFATEALAGLLDMTRLLTKIGTVKASVVHGNPASMRVLEKNGFARLGEGVFKSPIRGDTPVLHFERDLRRGQSLAVSRVPPAPLTQTTLRACA